MFADASAGYAAQFGASMRRFSPAGFRTMARSCADADLRPVLGRVDVPTLVLHGEHDVRAPRAVADALHDAIPGSRLVVVAGAGHVSSVEAPRQFNREVRDFLAAAAEG
jgi:pimeloyl-ACP methyl ester carboxylesterase